MKPKELDRRPKIISFRSSLEQLDVAASLDILWPCHAFTASIPVKKKRALNTLEETILKLTEVESSDTERLSDSCCLDQELVSFIQNRLYQLGLLSSRYEVSEQGKELLEDWSASIEEHEYTVVNIFVDLHNGQLIPYINSNVLSYENVKYCDNKNERVGFSIGAIGSEHSVNAKIIRPEKESHWDIVPTGGDVQKAIKDFRKNYNRYAILSSNNENCPPSLISRAAISIQDTPELVYLHSKIVVQKGNPDIVVTDGIGFGFSSAFRRHLVNKDFPWLADLADQGLVNTFDTENASDTDGIEQIPSKYREIGKRLKRAAIALDSAVNIDSDSTNSEREIRRYSDKAIKNLYASLEWSLRQVVFDNQSVQWESIFGYQSFGDNEKLLYEFARNIGFSLSEKSQSILQVKPGAIRQIANGTVELQPLLALSLAGANSDPNHPLHDLAYKNPGFLDLTFELKKLRDPIEHGGLHETGISITELQDIQTEVRDVISCMVSNVDKILGSDQSQTVSTDNVDQVRLKARLSLNRFFGLAFLECLSRELKEQLTRIEICKQELSEDNHMVFVTGLASSVQLAISAVMSDRSQSEVLSTDLKETAFQRAVEVGLIQNLDVVPKTLLTVRSDRVSGAAMGGNTTLGAQLIAFLALSSDQELTQIRNNTPHLIQTVAELISLRGHGNTSVIRISEDSLLSLGNSVFEIIRSLMES